MSNSKIIVGIFAHPDDEAFGPGGTLAKYASEGKEVYIICCTDGDHQEKGLKSIRDKELESSAKILGVKKVYFLNFTDGSLNNNQYSFLEQEIKKILDQILPDTVVTFDPNGVSGHIGHMVVTSVINHLFPKLDYLQKIMYFTNRNELTEKMGDYFVYFPPGRTSNQIDEIVDTSPVWDVQVKAMRAHVSQSADCEWILSAVSNLPHEDWFLVKLKS